VILLLLNNSVDGVPDRSYLTVQRVFRGNYPVGKKRELQLFSLTYKRLSI